MDKDTIRKSINGFLKDICGSLNADDKYIFDNTEESLKKIKLLGITDEMIIMLQEFKRSAYYYLDNFPDNDKKEVNWNDFVKKFKNAVVIDPKEIYSFDVEERTKLGNFFEQFPEYMETSAKLRPLVDWIKSNNIETPIKLELVIDKVANNGMTRYFNVKIDGNDVSGMVANALDLKISKGKGTYGDVIVPGAGMDMAFWLQFSLSQRASNFDEKDLFDPQHYTFTSKNHVVINPKEYIEKGGSTTSKPEDLIKSEDKEI